MESGDGDNLRQRDHILYIYTRYVVINMIVICECVWDKQTLGRFCIIRPFLYYKISANFAYEAKVPGYFYGAFMKFHPHFFRFDRNLKVGFDSFEHQQQF